MSDERPIRRIKLRLTSVGAKDTRAQLRAVNDYTDNGLRRADELDIEIESSSLQIDGQVEAQAADVVQAALSEHNAQPDVLADIGRQYDSERKHRLRRQHSIGRAMELLCGKAIKTAVRWLVGKPL